MSGRYDWTLPVIAGAVFGLNFGIAWSARSIVQAINDSRSAFICVEATKLNLVSPDCEKIIGKPRS